MKEKPTVIAVVNQKGGTAKTTTVENLGIGLAREGKKVLLVDTDPQGSLTISLGYPRPDELEVTLFDLLNKTINEDSVTAGEGILHQAEGIDLIPANISLAGLEVALVNTMNRERILKQFLEPVKDNYDSSQFVRLKSLGEDYTEEALKEKISRANVRDSHRQAQQPGIDLLIDIQNRALGKEAGYERWAKGFNLKQTAKTLLFLQQHDIHSYEDLERMTNEAVNGADQLLASIKEKDARIKEIEALRQHIFDYSKTRKTYLEYKRLPKAKKAEFYELHRAEIELQEAARASFDQLPEGTKLPTVKELSAERTRLIRERQAEYAEYRKVKADRTEFIRAKQNADVILNRQRAEVEEHEKAK